jgi:hypothetical protein
MNADQSMTAAFTHGLAQVAFDAAPGFAVTDVGQSTTVTLTLRNSGVIPLNALASSLNGDPAFTLAGGTCEGGKPPQGQACTVAVKFTPSSSGSVATRLTTKASDVESAFVNLSAIGRKSFVLTVKKIGTGDGTLIANPHALTCSGATCTATYYQTTTSETATLSATPDGTSTFNGWQGLCSGTSGCSLTMDSDKMVTALFARISVQLTIAGVSGASGAVNVGGNSCPSGTCTFNFAPNSSVTLTPTAAGGFFFGGWSGDCAGFDAPTCTLKLTSPAVVTATFTPANTVFYTSKSFLPSSLINIGGGIMPNGSAGQKVLAAADKTCNDIAASKGFPGTFIAWLSSSTAGGPPNYDAIDRLTTTPRGFVRPDKLPIFDGVNDITDSPWRSWYPRELDENGAGGFNYGTSEQVMTASDGGRAGANPLDCTGFTVLNSAITTGERSNEGFSWEDQGPQGSFLFQCTQAMHLFCFAKSFHAYVAPPLPPATGRRILFLLMGWVPNQTRDGADSTCTTTANQAGLAGQFLAMLATSTQSVATHVGQQSLPVYRPDGVRIADSDANLLSANQPQLIAPPGIGANGVPLWHTYLVFTGAQTPAATAPSGGNCNDWSSNASTATSIIGIPWWTIHMWFSDPNSFPGPNGFPMGCDQKGLIYCISK